MSKTAARQMNIHPPKNFSYLGVCWIALFYGLTQSLLANEAGIAAKEISTMLRKYSSILAVLHALITNFVSAAETVVPPISERFQNVASEGPYPESPNFQRHVVALLGRLGCNGRSCHGSFQGRGGFRLSMFGYDFLDDHRALLAGPI